MTDKQVFDKIAFQVGLAASFAAMVKHLPIVPSSNGGLALAKRLTSLANMQTQHVLRLIVTHRLAIERHKDTLSASAQDTLADS